MPMLQIAAGIVLSLFALRALSLLRDLVDFVSSKVTSGFDLNRSPRTRIDWRILRSLSPD
jgi:hypothetical protein